MQGLIIAYAGHSLAAPGDMNAEHQSGGNISHELAHQWFGNATTMEWWDSLFLNEGFATWVSPFTSLWLTYRALNIEWRVVDR